MSTTALPQPVHPANAAREPRAAPEPRRASATDDLLRLREEIEGVDRSLVRLVAERVRLARGVGAAKRDLGRGTLDPAREAAVVRHAAELAREAGLEDEEVRDIFWRLIALSRRAQMEGA